MEPHLFRFQFNTKAVHIQDAHTVRGIDAHPPAPAPTQTPTQQHGTRASHRGRQVQSGHLRLRPVLRTGASLNVAGSRACAAAGGRAIPGEYTQLPCKHKRCHSPRVAGSTPIGGKLFAELILHFTRSANLV